MISFAHPRSLNLLSALALFSLSFAASSLPAYIDHLSEIEVDQAYTLGQRHDQELVRFLRDYETTYGNVTPGTHVKRIAVRTPFCAVVLRSFEKGSTYPMVRSREDYAANPDPFQVVVSVDAPAPTPLVAADLADPKGQFWKQFAVEISQDARIAPRAITAVPLYGFNAGVTVITGGELRFEFDVRDIASKMIQVRVSGPGTQRVTAEFDLDQLR